MDKYYRTDGMHAYMVLSGIRIMENSYEMEMITHNELPALLSFGFRMLDNCEEVYYQIDGLTEIKALMENGELESRWVICMMQDLGNLLGALCAYLLSPDDLVLDPDGIFYSSEKKMFRFLYLPGYGRDIRSQIRELTEKLLTIISHKERRGVDFIYGLYDVVQQEYYDLEHMKEYIDSYAEGDQMQEKKQAKAYDDAGSEDYDTEKNSLKPKEQPEGVRDSVSGSEAFPEREKMMELLFSNKEAGIEKQNGKAGTKTGIWKRIIFGVTIGAGLIWTLAEVRQYGELYHTRPLMFLLLLLAAEIFICMGTERKTEKLSASEQPDALPAPGKQAEVLSVSGKQADALSVSGRQVDVLSVSGKQSDALPASGRQAEGETSVLSVYGEETSVLPAKEEERGKKAVYCLVPDRTCIFNAGITIADEDASILPEFRIDRDSGVIGRDRACADYCIKDETISRQHAMIRQKGETLILEDLNSTNGTFANDIPVLQGHPVKIKEGDFIRFGGISYYLVKESR